MADDQVDLVLGPALVEHWGPLQLKPEQRQALEALLAGRDSLVVLQTGFGKSLIYQLPAAASAGTTVVVTPLIALANDQLRELDDHNVTAALWPTSSNRERRLINISAGRPSSP